MCCHARVELSLAEATGADVYFSTPPHEVHAGDIEVIHTPGHTDNNVCYRYASPHGRTYLFTGPVAPPHRWLARAVPARLANFPRGPVSRTNVGLACPAAGLLPVVGVPRVLLRPGVRIEALHGEREVRGRHVRAQVLDRLIVRRVPEALQRIQ